MYHFSVVVDNWLPCKDPTRLKGKEKGLDHLPAFAKASNNQTWPCIVEKVFVRRVGVCAVADGAANVTGNNNAIGDMGGGGDGRGAG